MNLASQVAPQLPYLRRYARALAGDQQSGDSYVAAVLEAIVEEPQELQEAGELRVCLYKSFTKLWESVSLNMRAGPDTPTWEVSAQRRLSAISPKAREAFLLKAVEGFSQQQIGEILQRAPEEVEKLLAEASRSILSDVQTDVLIIEDEPIIAMELESIVAGIGHRVIGIAPTETEALRLASAKHPGLVLADIQLADGSSGLDAVNKMLRNFQVPVIFVTAYPERLLTGARPEPTFLITKPFLPDMIRAVVSQALFFDTKSRAAA